MQHIEKIGVIVIIASALLIRYYQFAWCTVAHTPKQVVYSSPTSFYTVRSDGTFWAWGENDEGQLADGSTVPKTHPMIHPYITRPVDACTVGKSACFVVKSGLKCTQNNKGQVVIWDMPGFPIGMRQIQCGHGIGVACLRTRSNNIICFSSTLLGEHATQPFSYIANYSYHGGCAHSISLTHQTLCTVTATGKVYCMGLNNYGQVGDGTTVDQPKLTRSIVLGEFVASAVIASTDYTCALVTENGFVFCWGIGVDGTIGPYRFGREIGWLFGGHGTVCAVHRTDRFAMCTTDNPVQSLYKYEGGVENIVSMTFGEGESCVSFVNNDIKCTNSDLPMRLPVPLILYSTVQQYTGAFGAFEGALEMCNSAPGKNELKCNATVPFVKYSKTKPALPLQHAESPVIGRNGGVLYTSWMDVDSGVAPYRSFSDAGVVDNAYWYGNILNCDGWSKEHGGSGTTRMATSVVQLDNLETCDAVHPIVCVCIGGSIL